MSKKAAEQYWLVSIASFILCTMRCICSIVECLCLKPNWWLGINLLFTTTGRGHFKMSFSKTLDIMGKRLMDW
jgi:hypothetical protein